MALYVEPRVIPQRWFADPDRDEAVRGVITDESGVVAFVTRVSAAGQRDLVDPFHYADTFVPPMRWEIMVERCRTPYGHRWQPKAYEATFIHGPSVYVFPCRFVGVGCYEAQFHADEGTVSRLAPPTEEAG